MTSIRQVICIGLLMAFGWGCLSAGMEAGGQDPLRVGVYPNEPKVFWDAQGRAAGFWPELLRAIAQAEGWQVQFVACEWHQCLQAVEEGTLDLMMDVAYSDRRTQRFTFNEEPVVYEWSAVYVRRGANLNSIVDLDRKRVGVLMDGIQLEALQQQAQQFAIHPIWVPVPNYEVMRRQLLNHDLDAGAINYSAGNLMESRYPITQTGVLVAPAPVHFVMAKSRDHTPLKTIDRHLRLLKAAPDSIYYQERDRWLSAPRSLQWIDLWRGLTVLGIGLATAGVLVIIGWNRSLRQEIRQRQQVEAALRQQEEQLRLVLELTRLGTWDWDLLSDRLLWSDNHFRLMGYAPGSVEPSYQQWRQRIHPEDVERLEIAIAQAQDEYIEYYAEYRVIYPNHTVHWLLGNGHCIRDDHGKVIRMVGVILDITQRKTMEEALARSEFTLKQILQAIPDLLIWMKVDGTCVEVAGGSGLENLILPARAIGRNQFEELPPELAQLRRAAIATVQQTGKMQIYDQQVILDGHIQYEEVRVVPTSEDQVLVMIRNISDRKYAELALAESEQRYRMVTESMTDLVCVHELDGRYLYLTPSVYPLLGYGQADLIGKNLLDFIHPDDQVSAQRAWEEALAGKTSSTTYRMQHRSGQYLWLETLIRHVLDGSGQTLHLQTTSRDVSDRVAIEEQLRRDALQDALTNLPNRVLLSERLTQALKRIKRYPQEQFAVLFLDFDRFKVINDSLGHSVGDELLQQLAKKLSQLVRETDLVARLGGDEFVILQETLACPAEANQLAERILEALRSPILIQEHTIFITASIGIALSSPEYETAETLIRNADIAMYRAKMSGRANYAIFDPDMHFQVLSRLQVENDLRQGLECGQFEIVYQPIVSLKTLDIVGFEALIRWQHPRMGVMLPEVFMEAAEESGLILPLGAWVLKKACAQLVDWQSHIPTLRDLYLTLNLSVKQLQGATLIPQIEQVLRTTGIAPHCLTLEITESLLVKDFEITSRILYQLQSKGIKISIDDFGTGYSSLSYLHQLPVDSLKIDRMFISGNIGSQRHRTIAESILALSNLLELNAIAEGIETQEQLQWLQSLSCEYGQGYLFSLPLKAQAAEDLLQATQLPWRE